MKSIIILGDGMADEPLEGYNNKTPLEMANIPNIDKLAKLGNCGTLKTVPDSLHPGSEVANMAILGYNVEECFEGRGVLEAASIGVELDDNDLALRCNFIKLNGDIIENHSANHINNEDASELIDILNKELGSEKVVFHKGISYRNLLVIKDGKKELNCTPPHDVPGQKYKQYLPTAIKPEAEGTAKLISDLIEKSIVVLSEYHKTHKNNPNANCIWPWSPGYKPKMPTLEKMLGIKSSAVISAVDLIQGIGEYAGMEVIHVNGATGLYDTNYEGKAKACIDAIKKCDFVYLHIEASDEAGHEGNVELKTKTIEYLDHRVVKYIIEECEKLDFDVNIGILPDHPTPCATTVHTRTPVPFVIYKPNAKGDSVEVYNEESVKKGSYGQLDGREFIEALIK